MAAPTVTGSVATNNSAGSVLTIGQSLTIAAGLTKSTLIVVATNPFGGQPQTADWNGTAMTSLSLVGKNTWKQAWYLNNPAAGTLNFNVNWGVFSSDVLIAAFVVQDAGNIEQVVQEAGFPTGTSGSQSITTTLADELLIGMFWNTPPANQTVGGTLLTDQQVSNYHTSLQSVSAPTATTYAVTTTFIGASIPYDDFIIALSASTGNLSNMFLVL